MIRDKKKILIFDMDGVLFDTMPFAQQAFLNRHPGVTEAMYKEIHTGNYYQGADKYSHLHVRETEQEKYKRELAYAEEKSKIHMFQGIKDLLADFHKAGYILALNTNARQRNCEPLLKNSHMEHVFDFLAYAEISQDKVRKFEMIADQYEALLKEMLFITDALGDVRDADQANVSTIAVTWGVHDKSYFAREPHKNLIAVVNTVADLKQEIQKYFHIIN